MLHTYLLLYLSVSCLVCVVCYLVMVAMGIAIK